MGDDLPGDDSSNIITENETISQSESNPETNTNNEPSDTDNIESGADNAEAESLPDINESANNDETADTDNSNNESDIPENESNGGNDESSDYEDIDALSGPGDFINRGTITYNLTGGTDGPTPNPEFALVGTGRPLSETEPIHDQADLSGEMTDVIFVGWSLTEPSGIFTISDELPELVTSVTIVLNENVTVYAVWKFNIPLTHEITFNLNGGNIAGDAEAVIISVVDGETIGNAIPVPVRTNHRFNGWRENGTEPLKTSDYIAELTIYEPRSFTASWTRINTGGGGGWIPIPPPIPHESEDAEELPEEPEPPEETPPVEEPPTEEIIPEEIPPIEEIPEIEYPPYEPYEPEEEISIFEPEPKIEEEYIETEEPQEEDENEEIASVIVSFTLTDIGNPFNGDVRRFRIINNSSAGLRFVSGTIPAFRFGNGITYIVRYRTNFNNSLRIMASNIPADRPFTLLPPPLTNGEVITEIKIEFDVVPVGFGVGDNIIYRFEVLYENNATNQYGIMFGEINQRNFFIGATFHNIDRLSNRENIYDEASWKNLQYTIEYAQGIISNPNSTTEEIEAAYFLLQQAISELNPIYSAAATTTAPPFALGRLFIAFTVLALVMGAFFAIIKLLKYKKRIAINLPKRALT